MTITCQPDGVYVVRGTGAPFLVANKPRKLGMTDPSRKGWAFCRLGGQSAGWGHKTMAKAIEAIESVLLRDATKGA